MHSRVCRETNRFPLVGLALGPLVRLDLRAWVDCVVDAGENAHGLNWNPRRFSLPPPVNPQWLRGTILYPFSLVLMLPAGSKAHGFIFLFRSRFVLVTVDLKYHPCYEHNLNFGRMYSSLI